MEENRKGYCFVIMPISDPDGYEKGHFRHVYEDIFCEAITKAGYIPKRADDENSSTMIQANIVNEIINAPMTICDLSTSNPNVLFELGIRQAFDLPVVLTQEKGTPRIFDISNINTIDYNPAMKYRDVIEVQKKITESILATEDRSRGINSIIKLLKISSADIPEESAMSDMDEIKMLIYSLTKEIEKIKNESSIEENIMVPNYEDIDRKRQTMYGIYGHKLVYEKHNIELAKNYSDMTLAMETRRKGKENIRKIISDITIDDYLSDIQREKLIQMGRDILKEADEKV